MNRHHLKYLIAAAVTLGAGMAFAQDSLIVTLPGQTFASGSGNSGTVAAQTVGTSFTIKLYAVSSGTTLDTGFSGPQTVTYSGPTGGATYTTTVNFTAGTNTTTVTAILTNAQTTTISATVGAGAPVASSSLLVLPELIVTLPGQTFVPGSGNSGSVSGQTAGNSFNIVSLTAVNGDNTIDTAFTGAQTVGYSGPANSPNATVPTYTTTVSFTAGQSTTTLATTLFDAQTTKITAGVAGAATGLASSSLTVAPNTATQLVFTRSTGGGQAGAAWKVQPVVTIEDANGNAVTGMAQNVSLAIQNNPGSGTLSGTTTAAVNTGTGAATFSGLSINNVGNGYTLTATGSTLDTSAGTVISPAFNIISLALYHTTVLNDGAYAYWPLQETNGAAIYDIAGTNNGNLMVSTDANNAGLGHDYETNFVNVGNGSSDGKSYNMGGPGKLFGVTNDSAIYFTNLNGQMVGSEIVVPYNSNMDVLSNFTAECLVHLPTYPIGYSSTNFNDQTILGFEANSGSQSGWFFDVMTDGTGASAGRLNGNLAHANHSGYTSTTISSNYQGGWVHAVLTYDVATFKVYENGNLVATFNNPGYAPISALPTHIEPFIIGSYCQSYFGGSPNTGNERARFFDGGVSHVAFYTNVLTAFQIQNHYQIAFFGGTNGPSFPTQPVGITNYLGYTNSLFVVAAGTLPLAYQWFKNNLPLSGQTNATLVFNNLVFTNDGNYFVTVTNALGSSNSVTVPVVVLPLPSDPYQSNVISDFPEAYYPLHETNGTLAADIIRTGDNNGTYVTQDTNIPPLLPLLGQPGTGSLGTSVTLNASVSNGIVINEPAAMGIVGQLTLEAWVLVQDVSDEQWIVAHSPAIDANPSKTADFLEINGGYYVVERYQQIATNTDFGAYYPIPPTDQGNWVYLVGVADGTNWILYENGVQVASVADTNTPPGAIIANGGWSIGGRNGNSNPQSIIAPSLTGSINNVAIYDYALSPATILQHYQIGVSPKMSIQSSGTNVIVNWTSGFLQVAPSVNGPWTYANTNTAVAPYTVGATNAATFFRATLTPPP